MSPLGLVECGWRATSIDDPSESIQTPVPVLHQPVTVCLARGHTSPTQNLQELTGCIAMRRCSTTSELKSSTFVGQPERTLEIRTVPESQGHLFARPRQVTAAANSCAHQGEGLGAGGAATEYRRAFLTDPHRQLLGGSGRADRPLSVHRLILKLGQHPGFPSQHFRNNILKKSHNFSRIWA